MADFSKLVPGLTGTARAVVTDPLMAPHAGSGSAPVFASPSMIAIMEGAAVDCVEKFLPPQHISLGTHLDVHHLAATPKGLTVTARATLLAVDGRKLTFSVEAHDGIETVGRGTHTRVAVDNSRFMARLEAKAATRETALPASSAAPSTKKC